MLKLDMKLKGSDCKLWVEKIKSQQPQISMSLKHQDFDGVDQMVKAIIPLNPHTLWIGSIFPVHFF